MSDSPFDSLVGHKLDTVSFVCDYIELRIDYSIVRLLTDPSGSIDGDDWRLTETSGADMLRRYIGRSVVEVDFVEDHHVLLHFEGGPTIHALLRDEDRRGPEALHFMPADERGQVHTSNMWIW